MGSWTTSKGTERIDLSSHLIERHAYNPRMVEGLSFAQLRERHERQHFAQMGAPAPDHRYSENGSQA